MTTYAQMEQLVSLLNLITMNGTIANASNIGGSKNETCKYIISGWRDVSLMDIFFITQSPTGLFENRIKINQTPT